MREALPSLLSQVALTSREAQPLGRPLSFTLAAPEEGWALKTQLWRGWDLLRSHLTLKNPALSTCRHLFLHTLNTTSFMGSAHLITACPMVNRYHIWKAFEPWVQVSRSLHIPVGGLRKAIFPGAWPPLLICKHTSQGLRLPELSQCCGWGETSSRALNTSITHSQTTRDGKVRGHQTCTRNGKPVDGLQSPSCTYGWPWEWSSPVSP